MLLLIQHSRINVSYSHPKKYKNSIIVDYIHKAQE